MCGDFLLIDVRLREERDRLGLTQEVFADAAGAKRRTLVDWEKGVSSPTAVQLSALAAVGVDVQYVLTGQRKGSGFGESAVHQAVLDAVDLLSLEKKVDAAQLAKAVVKLVTKSAPSTESSASVQVAGDFNGQMVEGDAINTGTMNFGGKHRHKKS